MLERNFTVMVVIYVLFSGYEFGYGSFYKLICPKYIRWILNNLIYTAFESSIVVSIMYLHHKCAQIHKDAPEVN